VRTRSSIGEARNRFRQFIASCGSGSAAFSLTPKAEPTLYATCFALFGLHLLQDVATLSAIREETVHHLRSGLRAERQRLASSAQGKPFRQLLAFALSALAVLESIDEDPLDELVREQLTQDVKCALESAKALEGVPQSGNQAMFTAVFLLHAGRYLGMDTHAAVDCWVALHLERMNRFGFWGPDTGMTHLAFQNGYHQYEIFEYLGVRNPRQEEAVAAVRGLADADGRFAPYPGGGGCYDYDAVFVMTPEGRAPRSCAVHAMPSSASRRRKAASRSRAASGRDPWPTCAALRGTWRPRGGTGRCWWSACAITSRCSGRSTTASTRTGATIRGAGMSRTSGTRGSACLRSRASRRPWTRRGRAIGGSSTIRGSDSTPRCASARSSPREP
jgi:hypothetical protein